MVVSCHKVPSNVTEDSSVEMTIRGLGVRTDPRDADDVWRDRLADSPPFLWNLAVSPLDVRGRRCPPRPRVSRFWEINRKSDAPARRSPSARQLGTGVH